MYFGGKGKLITQVIWVKDSKVRVQVGGNKRNRVTVPLSMVTGVPKKGGQLRVWFDDEDNPEKAEVPKRKHVCKRWEYVGYSSTQVRLYCNVCDKHHSRDLTEKEKHILFEGESSLERYMLSSSQNKEKTIHTVYHDFRDKFLDSTGRFKAGENGYDLMQKVARWAKKWPDDVKVVSCDDSHHMSSDLYLIEHKAERVYFGTTVVYVSQADPPAMFFLYPSHTKSLIKALKQIRSEAAAIEKLEQQDRAERNQELNKLFRNG